MKKSQTSKRGAAADIAQKIHDEQVCEIADLKERLKRCATEARLIACHVAVGDLQTHVGLSSCARIVEQASFDDCPF